MFAVRTVEDKLLIEKISALALKHHKAKFASAAVANNALRANRIEISVTLFPNVYRTRAFLHNAVAQSASPPPVRKQFIFHNFTLGNYLDEPAWLVHCGRITVLKMSPL